MIKSIYKIIRKAVYLYFVILYEVILFLTHPKKSFSNSLNGAKDLRPYLKISNLKLEIAKAVRKWKALPRKKQRALSAVMIVITMLINTGIYLIWPLIFPKTASAAWFNEDWNYRQTVSITNSGSAQTEYQVAITLDTATLITASKMQSNCADIRVIDQTGKSLPLYTINCNNSATAIWTKLSLIGTTGNTLYVYYGNPSASSTSNPGNVFIADNIHVDQGDCGSGDANCDGSDSHAEFDTVITYPVNICSQNVTKIDWGSPCDGSAINSTVRDHFYTRYRLMFVPKTTGTWTFATDSDDGSEVVLNSNADVAGATSVATFYGNHGSCGCTTHSGTQSLTVGQGIWLEYRMTESGGNETELFYITSPSGTAQILNSANWPGSYFTRKYTSTEPTIGSPTNEEKGPSPVAYWKFDEGYGATAYDSTTNTQNVTAQISSNGSGSDGDVTFGSGTTNLSTTAARSCTNDGTSYGSTLGWAPIYRSTVSTAAGATAMTVTTSPSSTCLTSGDEVLIINLMGASGNTSNVGKYETRTVSSVSGTTVNFNVALTNAYDGSTQKIMVQRIPNFRAVTVSNGGTVTGYAFDSTAGGVVAFRASNGVTLSGTGTISANGLGYLGGAGGSGSGVNGTGGQSYDGNGTATTGTNGNGNTAQAAGTAGTRGGGGAGSAGGSSGGGGGGGYGGGGGGGGYSTTPSTGGATTDDTGTAAGGGAAGFGGTGGNAGSAGGAAGNGSGGAAGTTTSCTGIGSGLACNTGQGGGHDSGGGDGGGGGGGGLYGSTSLASAIFLGSGGGGGGYSSNRSASSAGAAGGGIVFVSTNSFTIGSSAAITATGNAGTTGVNSGSINGGGGGGAGGSILLQSTNSVALGTTLVTAKGGAGGAVGGSEGGSGRIYVASSSVSGTTNPTVTTSTSLSALTVVPNWQPESQCATGKCVYFNGTTNFMAAGSDVTQLKITGGLTLSAWIRANDLSSTHDIITKWTGTGSSSSYSLFTDSSGKLNMKISDSSGNSTTYTGNVSLTANQWYYVAAVYNPSTSVSLYINGVLDKQSTLSIPSSLKDSTTLVAIGSENSGSTNYFSGFIDDVKIYNFAKTSAQIAVEYNSKGVRNPTASTIANQPIALSNGLVDYYKMDEASTATSAVDTSGNSNTASAIAASTGTGNDGDVSFAADFNLGTTAARSCADDATTYGATLGWAPAYVSTASTAAAATAIVTTQAPASTCLTAGDEVLIINLMGTSGDNSNVGKYETKYVSSVSSTTINFTTALTNAYDGTSQKIMVQRVPNFHNVTISDTKILSGFAYDGTAGGGVLFFRASGTLSTSTSGKISMNGSGYTGGAGASGSPFVGFGGQSYDGAGGNTSGSNGNGRSNDTSRSAGTAGTRGGGGGGGTGGAGAGGGGGGGYGGGGGGAGGADGGGGTGGAAGTGGNTDIGAGGGGGGSDGCASGGAGGNAGSNGVDGTSSTPGAGGAAGTGTSTGQGGGGAASGSCSPGGGGGGGGGTYGASSLASKIYLGSGGAGGGGVAGQNGANGGGIIIISANTVTIGASSTISSNGTAGNSTANGQGAGGGGAGGSVIINSPNAVALGSGVTTSGGAVATTSNAGGAGGAGGVGRINVNSSSTTGSTTPSYSSTNTVTSTTGKFNLGESFDGSTYALSAGNGATLQITGALTLSAWVNLTSNNATHDIVTKNGASGQFGYRLYTNASGKAVMEVASSLDGSTLTTAVGTTTLSTSTWYHLTGVYIPGKSVGIYVNGVLESFTTNSVPSSIKNSSASVNIGSENGGASNFMSGSLDEVRIYNKALSDSDVSILYNFGPNPVGYWNFDEKTGTTANDSTGNSNAGTITAGKGGWTNGKYGDAYNFDKATTKVDAGSGATLDDLKSTAGLTAEAWIYPKSTGEGGANGGVIVGKATGPTNTVANGWFFYMTTSNDLEFRYDGATDLQRISSTAVTLNAWNHVAVTWDGSTTAANSHVYINGVEVSYGTTTNGVTLTSDASTSLIIGNDSTQANTFDGFIDDVKVYNYIRTQKQEVEDMNAGHPAPGSPVGSPAGWWKFDEGYGTTAHDSSVNANNGDTSGVNTGTGADGAVTFGSSFNLNTTAARSCADDATTYGSTLGWAPIYISTANTAAAATSIVVTTSPASTCLTAGDEVLIIDLMGSSAANSNVGKYETKYVSSVSSGTINLTTALTNAYDGTSGTQKIMVQRIPQFTTVGVSNTLTALTFDGTAGGVLMFRATGAVSLTGSGAISANAIGYNGGAGAVSGNRGQSYDTTGSDATDTSGTNGNGRVFNDASSAVGTAGTRGGGGTGGYASDRGGGGGGGGGYGGGGGGGGGSGDLVDGGGNGGAGGTGGDTGVSAGGGGGGGSHDSSSLGGAGGNAGNAGTTGAASAGPGGAAGSGATTGQGGGDGGVAGGAGGGGTYGNTSLTSTIYMGSGGGSGGGYNVGPPANTGKTGGNGGGIIGIFANSVSLGGSAAITSNGGAGTGGGAFSGGGGGGEVVGGGGGGAGGSIMIQTSQSLALGSSQVAASGGAAGSCSCANGSGGGGGVGRINILASSTSGSTTPTATTASPAPTWSNAGKFGKALTFVSASSQYMKLASDVNAMKITGAMTLSAWINATSFAAQQDIICKWTGTASTSSYCLYTNTNGQLVMGISDGSTITTTTETAQTLVAGTWYHVVGIYNPSSSVTLYVNGVAVKQNTTSIPSALNNSSTVLNVGAENNGSNFMNGTLDEVKAYSSAFSSSQVALDMNRGQAQVLGALSDNSSYQPQAANQEYCVPGDSTSCAAPITELKFDEKTGSTVNDTSGNSNTGTWAGTLGSQWTFGKFGAAGKFNATDNEVTVNDSSSTELTGDLTISMWLKPGATQSGFANILRKESSSKGYGIEQTGSGNDYYFGWKDNSGTAYCWSSNSFTLTANVWQHVEIVKSGATRDVYINGVKTSASCTAASSSIGTSTASLSLGAWDGTGRYWNGLMDNFRLYNYALTPAQIAWEYNRGGPIGWWKFDECQGATAYDASGTNSNNGTITIGGSGTSPAGTCSTASTAWGNGVTGKLNASLSYDGTDDYTLVSSPTGASTTNFSIAFWFKATSNSGTTGIFQWASSLTDGSPFVLVQDDAGTLKFYTYNNGGAVQYWDTTKTIVTGTWYHVVVTFDTSNNFKSYVNGVPSKTFASSGVSGNHANLYFGNGFNGYFNGQIDDARIYNYTLTAGQIKSLAGAAGSAVRYGPATGSP